MYMYMYMYTVAIYFFIFFIFPNIGSLDNLLISYCLKPIQVIIEEETGEEMNVSTKSLIFIMMTLLLSVVGVVTSNSAH